MDRVHRSPPGLEKKALPRYAASPIPYTRRHEEYDEHATLSELH
jgi:hypothetical protein